MRDQPRESEQEQRAARRCRVRCDDTSGFAPVLDRPNGGLNSARERNPGGFGLGSLVV
jgi:hypothetical protein